MKKFATDKRSLERDTEVDFLRGSGPGGQRRNRRETGVRITHHPSSIVVVADNLASQAQNREVAFKRLRDRLYRLNKPKKPRIPTRPPLGVQEKRVRAKHWNAKKKEMRRKPSVEL